MGILLWIFLVVAPFLLGNGIVRVLYGKRYRECCSTGESILAGFCVLIGAAEAVHLAGVLLKWRISAMTTVWCVLVGVLLLVGALFMFLSTRDRKDACMGKHAGGSLKRSELLLAGAFAVSVLFQVILIMTGDQSFREGDMTLETVRTFLVQDQVYSVNPLTGQPYGTGIPFRVKILCLPSLYTFLCRLTGLEAEMVVCRIIPGAVLLFSYAAYAGLGKLLFGKDRAGRLLMLLLVSLLFWCGDYLDSMDGFRLLHCGYQGLSIRTGILLPFTLAMCLRKKWKLVILAAAAEACIVWTFYGLGACLLMGVGMLLVGLWINAGGRRGGKACRNS